MPKNIQDDSLAAVSALSERQL